MKKRKWGIFSALAYFYNAFACLADGKLVKEETSKIIEMLLGWTNKEEDDVKAIAGAVVQAEIWLKEDIDGSDENEDLVNDSLNMCIEIVKKKFSKDQCKAVLIDLIEIGMADGNYDESEKGWVKMLSDRLGIEPPNIQNSVNESAEVNGDEIGYAGITIKKFENESKQEAVNKFLIKWQDKTKTYNGKLGITGMIPEYFEDIDQACPKWSSKELDSIIKHSKDKKVVPSLKYVPDDFFTMTKQVWWLVPFVIWRNDLASWLFIDKNGFYAPHPDTGHGTLIFSWDNIGSVEFDEIEHNLFRLSLHQLGNDGFLSFDEFVPIGSGSYLKMVYNIYKLYQPTIEASRDAQQWFHGVGGEGMKSFESPSDLLIKEKWEDANYPNPSFYGYIDPKMNEEQERINKIIEKSSGDWTEEEINQIIKHKNYGKGSKNGDDLILKIVSSNNISDSWLEDFALAGLHSTEVVKHIAKNLKTDEFILENLYQRETTKDWSEVDRLVLEHPNCPDSIKKTVSANDTEVPEQHWNIIHDIGVFYMYFANLAEHPDGDLKDDELDYILNVYPKWKFNFDGIKYGFENDNPTGLQETWDFIFSKMYSEGDPMPSVNESHKNLIGYINEGYFTKSNLNTFLQTLYDLSNADSQITDAQKHQLIYYCDFFKSGSETANKILSLINPEETIGNLDEKFENTIFDNEGKPIIETENNPHDDKVEEKSKTNKELTLQGQLAVELSKLYPTADVKKVDNGNYLDIHMPDIHPKRGTHIWFNTPKAGGIKVGFFCRDKDFIEDATNRNPSAIETYANGLRLSGHPTYSEVNDAMKAADEFVKMLKK